MKLGAIHLADDLETFRREVRLSEALGYDVVGVGDSPAGWRDLIVSMTLAVEDTERAIVAPMVTSPFLRHPLALASALSTLQDFSGGRIALGFATGGSTIMALGQAPATMARTREEMAALRTLMDGAPIQWDGRDVKELRRAHRTPIYFSAFGPKALQLAGEVADGAILFAGSESLDELDRKIEAVRASAKSAGRSPDDIDMWVVSYCSVRDSRKAAIEDLKAFIVVNGMAIRTPETLAQVPGQFRGKIEQLHARYDPSEHVVVGGRNVKLMEELGLTEFLAQFDTVAGTSEEVRATLDAIASRGVSCFFAALPGHADREGQLRRLAQAMGRVPERVAA